MKRSDRASALKKLLPLIVVSPTNKDQIAARRFGNNPHPEVRVDVKLPKGSRPHGDVTVYVRERKRSDGELEYLQLPTKSTGDPLPPRSESGTVFASTENNPGASRFNTIFEKDVRVSADSQTIEVTAVVFYDQVYGKVEYEPNGDKPMSLVANGEELSPVLNPGKDVGVSLSD